MPAIDGVQWHEYAFTFLQETKGYRCIAYGVKPKVIWSIKFEKIPLGYFSEKEWNRFRRKNVPYWGKLEFVGQDTYQRSEEMLRHMYEDVVLGKTNHIKDVKFVLFG